MKNLDKKRILILGASGFIGSALYRELSPYYDTFGTYCTQSKAFGDNKRFVEYNLEEDDIYPILEQLRPNVIISALRGDFAGQVLAHQHMVEYLVHHECRLLFLSSANVFDAYSQYPSYEFDKTLSESIYGRFKIKIENMLMRLSMDKMAILRLPMVFGNTSTRIRDIRKQLAEKEPIEVFPNLIINVTNADRLTQQVHYIINRDLTGIFHLGSKDLVHHEEFIGEVVKHLGGNPPIYKRVYTTNDDRYLAVLPKHNKLPKNLQIDYQEIIDHHLLK